MSELTPCPYCGDTMSNPRRVQCGKESCLKKYNAERTLPFARAYAARLKAEGRKRAHSLCYEHVCQQCGKAYKSGKAIQNYCSQGCYSAGSDERQRQKLLPILHPNPVPYTRLPGNHPAVLMQQPQYQRLFIANTCTICGATFITSSVRHATCGSLQCLAQKKRAERRSRKAYERALTRGRQPGVFSASQWGSRLVEYDSSCAYCGSDDSLEIEHVIPLGRGGSNRIANIVPACRACNQDKGSMTPEEWKACGSSRVSCLDSADWPAGAWEEARSA